MLWDDEDDELQFSISEVDDELELQSCIYELEDDELELKEELAIIFQQTRIHL